MTVLSEATKVYHDGFAVRKIYRGTEQVWPAVFDPTTLAGLTIWLDAADYTSGPWTNRVVGGPGTQIIGAPSPAAVPAAKNGLPVVRFKANEGRVRMTADTGIDLNYTLVYVARLVGPTIGRIVNGSYTPANILFGWWNGFEDVAYAEGFLTPDMRKAWTTDWIMYSADGEGLIPVTYDDYMPRLFRNGTLLSGGTVKMAGGWKGTFCISGYDPGGAQETPDAEVAEVLFYNRKLSDADRQQVEGYLREKWGL